MPKTQLLCNDMSSVLHLVVVQFSHVVHIDVLFVSLLMIVPGFLILQYFYFVPFLISTKYFVYDSFFRLLLLFDFDDYIEFINYIFWL